ncbi:unnamed protein product, partial [marine sediment metagenome]
EEFAKFYAIDKDVDAITSLGNGNKKVTHLEGEITDLKNTITEMAKENVQFREDIDKLKEWASEMYKEKLERENLNK